MLVMAVSVCAGDRAERTGSAGEPGGRPVGKPAGGQGKLDGKPTKSKHQEQEGTCC
ncbi:hypothetical protein ABZ863_34035 [Saccharomonospora sp. NPDC046836]|uniref:hypothetical protein n=2 Tax=Actinomycetes TaxID=1760 RepID=UPI0033D703AA